MGSFTIPGVTAPLLARTLPPATASSQQPETDCVSEPAVSSPVHKRARSPSPTKPTIKHTRSSSSALSPAPRKKIFQPKQDEDQSTPALGGVPDYLPSVQLDLVLVGINPGLTSARQGRHYAHHTNHFYRCLHLSGLTSRLLQPVEDEYMPYLPELNEDNADGPLGPFRVGLTNLSPRPTREMSQLTAAERRAAVKPLLAKLIQAKPKAVGFVGKGIAWDSVRATPVQGKRRVALPKGTPVNENGYGVMPYCLVAEEEVILLFALPSTSARVTSLQLPGKAEWFARLRELVAYLQTASTDTETTTVELAQLQ